MVNWSQLVPSKFADHFSGILQYPQGLPLYAKLGASAAVLALLAWLVGLRARRERLPPGPWGFPLLGAFHQLTNKKFKDFARLRRIYGDVFSFRLSTSFWVVVNGYPAIKEALVKKAEVFSGRPESGFDMMPYTDPLFMADYNDSWKTNKKFAMTSLRSLIFGSQRLESKIFEEITEVISKLKAHKGEGVSVYPYLCYAMTRIIMRVTICGDRIPADEETEYFQKLILKIMCDDKRNHFEAVATYLPSWLAKLTCKAYVDELNRKYAEYSNYVKEKISSHQATLDPDQPRDALDLYISKRLGKDMTEGDIVDTLYIFHPDAIETLSNAVSSAVLHITHHPEIQAKIHEELDRVVGASVPVNYDQRATLPYLQATLLEADRIASLLPLAAGHKATRNTTLLGYDIPKDAIVVPNLHSVHFDEDIFPNPDQFDPAHFLDDGGKLTNTEYCIPFSVGRRVCMGETLSKLEKFLFVANLFQAFHFSFPPEQPNPPTEGSRLTRIFLFPSQYKLCVHLRS